MLPHLLFNADISSWKVSVKPFIPQFSRFNLLYSPSSFHELYYSTNPLIMSVMFSFVMSTFVYIVSEITGNVSQVDRLWSVIPVLYSLHFLWYGWVHGLASPRLFMLVGLSVLWGIRLTFNYARKGGYKCGSEDYRWAIVRTWMSPLRFHFFNLIFIAFIQNFLVLSITTPAYIVLIVGNNTPLWWMDLFAVLMIIISLTVEAVADEQQWSYQQAKSHVNMVCYSPQALKRGFLAEGMWAFSRHPNYLGELGVWLGYYLSGCAACKHLLNWSIIGWISYAALLQGSTSLTEQQSSNKYPLYQVYQKHVGKIIPVSMKSWSPESLEVTMK